MDHPAYCGLSTDFCVPHSSHCCACLLEVSIFPLHAETDHGLKHVWNDVFLLWSCVFYFVGCYDDRCISWMHWLLECLCWVNYSTASNTVFLCREIWLLIAMSEPAVMSTDISTVSLSLSREERWSWEKSPVRLNSCVILMCLFSSFVFPWKGDKII